MQYILYRIQGVFFIMNPRQERGLQIAQTKTIQAGIDGWVVPSQSSSRKYFVRKDFSCSCPDCKEHNVKCKHAFAVEYFLNIEKTNRQGVKTIEKVRVSYPQAWHVYNQAQQSEGKMFDELLKDLVADLPEEEYFFGRPSLSNKESAFCSIKKVYSRLSSRRAKSLFNRAVDSKQLNHSPHFNAVSKFLNKETTTVLLQELLVKTAEPLQAVETSFAIDSSGFRTTRFNEYCKEKHDTKKKHEWIKAHICCGVKTNVITGALITEGSANDSPMLPELVVQTSQTFDAGEYSADKGYCSRKNMQFISDTGAKPFILFKDNTKPKAFGCSAWRNAWHFFSLHKEEFLQHYHKRSNVETTFFMVKSKLGDSVKSKNFTAQKNELLCKLIAHNIIVLIQEIHELGISVNFAKEYV